MTTEFDALPESPAERRRFSRARGWLIGVALVLLIALVGLWLARAPIARHVVDRTLAERGVAARYTIAELGPGGQRLTDVVIGDPAHPDLTADWIETRTGLGLGGATLTGVRAGQVRMRGRIVGGRVSLGALDRLLPAPSGAPFALPDIRLEVADGRLRLDTPAGPVGVKLVGAGRLTDGFAGTLAAFAPRLAAGGCVADRVSGYWQVSIADRAPRLRGPTRVAAVGCAGARVEQATATLDATLGPALDRWRASARVAVAEVRAPNLWLRAIGGTVGFAGDRQATGGEVALTSGASAVAGASATGAGLNGRYRIGAASGFSGTFAADHASLPARWRAVVLRQADAGAGSPAAPLVDRAAHALALAGRDAAVRAELSAGQDASGWRATVTRLTSESASGARLGFGDGRGITLAADRPARIDGTLTLAGGGLPEGRIALAQAAPGAPLVGTARFAAYAARDARLALSPVAFRATPGGRTQFSTVATLSGPLGDGRIEAATLPVVGGWDGGRRLVVNPGCARAGFARLAVAGLVLERSAFALCPAGRALLTLDGGRVGGGARLAAARLRGTLGGTPLTLAARGGELRFGDGGFTLGGVAARLGQAAPFSRLELATLSGQIAGGGVAGRYAGGAGRIGAVPLLMSEAAGTWRLSGGRLSLDGALTVADAAPDPRFKPLAASGVALTLADGQIRATGDLIAPASGTKVARVAIRHRLSDASGTADLSVPGVTFGDKLQPTDLTRLTLGVIAEVRGTVAGTGQVRWGASGVTSDGTFHTDAIDLAAAFGPVTGLKGEIRFTDLLALESAPGQVATVAGINPGVPVTNGVVRYQTLAGPMLRVEDARWPFAGGLLVLEPTLLDYSRSIDKRMTFRIEGLDAAQFLQGFDYKNLSATGVFDGTLPMVFDDSGGRIEAGRLHARTGGTLAYVGEVSQENLGFWGNLAFGALKSLKYRSLDLKLYGPLAGEIVTEARFGGIAQGAGAKSNFVIRRLARLPFVFNVKITAPFRALLDSARGFYDPQTLIQRNLPQLIQEQKRAVQPPASGAVPQEKPN